MIKKPMFWVMLTWFILVNAAQVFPSLNTVEPYVMGIPFNLAWIWGWNALITLYLIYFAMFGSKSHNVDEEVAFAYAKKIGIKGLK
mgnify:CR=1 FL=1